MGVGYLVTCKKCGMSKQLMLGSGGIHPSHFRTEILEGKFGEEVKQLQEQNPDVWFPISHILYGCSCGYVTEFREVDFLDSDVPIGRKPHRCSNCGKKLKRNDWGSRKCWKCGSDLDIMENIKWD